MSKNHISFRLSYYDYRYCKDPESYPFYLINNISYDNIDLTVKIPKCLIQFKDWINHVKTIDLSVVDINKLSEHGIDKKTVDNLFTRLKERIDELNSSHQLILTRNT